MSFYKIKYIPGYDRQYAIDHVGRVFSFKGRQIRKLKEIPTKKGYVRVSLSHKGVTRPLYIHRLVLLTFEGPPPKGKEADHKNRDRSDNRWRNLKYVTSKENSLNTKQLRGAKGLPITVEGVKTMRYMK